MRIRRVRRSSGAVGAVGAVGGRKKRARPEARPFMVAGGAGPPKTQFTKPFRPLSARMRTFFEAGFALKVIFSPVNGLTP